MHVVGVWDAARREVARPTRFELAAAAAATAARKPSRRSLQGSSRPSLQLLSPLEQWEVQKKRMAAANKLVIGVEGMEGVSLPSSTVPAAAALARGAQAAPPGSITSGGASSGSTTTPAMPATAPPFKHPGRLMVAIPSAAAADAESADPLAAPCPSPTPAADGALASLLRCLDDNSDLPPPSPCRLAATSSFFAPSACAPAAAGPQQTPTLGPPLGAAPPSPGGRPSAQKPAAPRPRGALLSSLPDSGPRYKIPAARRIPSSLSAAGPSSGTGPSPTMARAAALEQDSMAELLAASSFNGAPAPRGAISACGSPHGGGGRAASASVGAASARVASARVASARVAAAAAGRARAGSATTPKRAEEEVQAPWMRVFLREAKRL